MGESDIVSIRKCTKSELEKRSRSLPNKVMQKKFLEIGGLLIDSKLLALSEVDLLEQYIQVLFQLKKLNVLFQDAEDPEDIKRLNSAIKSARTDFLSIAKLLGLGAINRSLLLPIIDLQSQREKMAKMKELRTELDTGKITQEQYKKAIAELEED